MRLDPRLEGARIRAGVYGSPSGMTYGAFNVTGPCGMDLYILSSGDEQEEWEHVSVSGRRTPNWQEMSFVKDLFWDAEVCM